MPTPIKTKHINFDKSASGDHIALNGFEGRTIRLKSWQFTSSGNQTVQFKCGPKVIAEYVLSGNSRSITSPGMAWGDDYFIEVEEGVDFIINLSNGMRLSGFIVCEQS